MSQEKTAEIIDLSASRAAAASDGAGAFLAQARHAAGLHVVEVAEATKIKAAHIEAIEVGDAAALPATPYAVGFVKVYAAYLGLDGDAVAADFKKELIAARPPAEEPSPAAMPVRDVGDSVKLVSLLGILMVAIFAIWIGVQIAGKSERTTSADDAAPRVTVADRRAEAPRPRRFSPAEYEVTPIPPVGGAPEEQVTAQDENAVAASEQPAQDENAAPSVAPASADPAPVLAPVVAPVEPETVTQPAVSSPAPATPFQRQPAPAEPDPVIVDARLVRSIGPEYPGRCVRGAEPLETVSVIFDVNANGRPANARVTSSTNSCFEDAAVAAIAKWRFDPRTVDGAPRPQPGVEATLNFRQ